MGGAGLRLIGVHTAISIRGNYRHFDFHQDRGRYSAEANFQPNRHFNPSPWLRDHCRASSRCHTDPSPCTSAPPRGMIPTDAASLASELGSSNDGTALVTSLTVSGLGFACCAMPRTAVTRIPGHGVRAASAGDATPTTRCWWRQGVPLAHLPADPQSATPWGTHRRLPEGGTEFRRSRERIMRGSRPLIAQALKPARRG